MDVEAIVARIWPGEEARVEVLGGGITNHNFKVESRRPVRAPHRRARHRAARDRPLRRARGGARRRRGRGRPGGGRLRRARGLPRDPLHRGRRSSRSSACASPSGSGGWRTRCAPSTAGRRLPARFISFRVVEDYRTTAFAHGAEVPPSYAWARQVARRVERARGAFAERPCHNDLLNANFIDDGGRLRIVDWEYAGMGDVFFDLANFSINHGLDRDEPAGCCSRPTSARSAAGRARARADAVHVGLPRGDVGRRPGGGLRARLRLRRLRRRALRAHGGDRRLAGVRRRARARRDAPAFSLAVPEHGRGRGRLGREADERDDLEPTRCVPHVTRYRPRATPA